MDKLLGASRKNNSLVCVGLDPDPALMPDVDVLEFNRQIVEATKDLVCAYKPNFAFYEALGTHGFTILEKTLKFIPGNIPVIADAKRGDIGNTAKKYASSLFEVFGFDAATINPYMGADSVEPFTDYQDKGIFILCCTTNSGAADFQHLLFQNTDSDADAIALFQLVAIKAKKWNVHNNIGLVVGATHPRVLKQVRAICPDAPLLIPGIGPQKGDLISAVKNGVDMNGEKAIINSSRQILYSSRGRDYPTAARMEASKLRARINRLLTK